MNTSYISITPSDKLSALAEAVIVRERELFGYGINIANYTAMLDPLPSGAAPDDADDLSREQYAWRDRLLTLLKSERLEQWKSNLAYNALLSQLPADETQRAALIEEAKARMSKASS
jgi:hypothetical protein